MLVVAVSAEAQSIRRQSIGTLGQGSTGSGLQVIQSVGQPYQAGSYHSGTFSVIPGYVQPTSPWLAMGPPMPTVILTTYPNPATDVVSFLVSEAIHDLELRAYNQMGQLVLEEKVPDLRAYQMHCRDWPKGVYLLQLSDATGVRFAATMIKNQTL